MIGFRLLDGEFVELGPAYHVGERIELDVVVLPEGEHNAWIAGGRGTFTAPVISLAADIDAANLRGWPPQVVRGAR